jgi:hypothetical protein
MAFSILLIENEKRLEEEEEEGEKTRAKLQDRNRLCPYIYA